VLLIVNVVFQRSWGCYLDVN